MSTYYIISVEEIFSSYIILSCVHILRIETAT